MKWEVLSCKSLDFLEGIKGLVEKATWNSQKMLDNIFYALKKLRGSGKSKADNTRLNNSINKSFGEKWSLKCIEVLNGVPQRSTSGICLFNILTSHLVPEWMEKLVGFDNTMLHKIAEIMVKSKELIAEESHNSECAIWRRIKA